MRSKRLKILILRLSSLGDIVNLTVIFSKIRKKFPDAEIHFVTKIEFLPLVKQNRYHIKVLPFDSKTGLKGWKTICQHLHQEDYDYFLDMHSNLRSRFLKFYLRNVSTKRFQKPRLKRFLLFYLLINLFPKSFNLISEYLRVLTILGIDETEGKTDILLENSISTTADKVLADHGVNQEFVVILPIAAWKNKRYSLKKYQEVSKMIVKTIGIQVVWLGGKRDDYLDEICFETSQIKKIIGETSLMESMAVLEKAKVVIGNDTGLTYAAQALGTPVLIIEGPTSRETGAGHTQCGSQVLEKELWCRPCSQKGDRKCYRKKQFCLNFTPDEVYKKFEFVYSGVIE